MQAATVEELFSTVLPFSFIQERAEALGVQKRQRFFEPARFVLSLVLNGGTAEAGRMAAALREYEDRGGRKVARSAYYRWFDDELLRLMEELVERAREYVTSMPMSLPGVLAGRRDWRAVDSSTVKLPQALADVFPGTGEYAALKVHAEVSLGVENVVDWHITPAKRHDSPELVIDEKRAGTGLLVDLGYVSHDLVRRCHEHDVQFVVRLKKGWKAFLDSSVFAGEVDSWQVPLSLLEQMGTASLPDILDVPLDVDVRLGEGIDGPEARLINVQTPEGWRAYLTNVPRETHDAEAISFLYSLRWAVELHFKLAKSGCELDEIYAERPVSAKILVHAAVLASLLANALAHIEHLDQGYVDEKVVRPTAKRPPVHAMTIWKMVRTSAGTITDLLSGEPTYGKDWERVAQSLRWAGKDPNWRRRPSPMDDAKGRNPAGRAMWRHRKRKPRKRTRPK